jgi:hypothetical protein
MMEIEEELAQEFDDLVLRYVPNFLCILNDMSTMNVVANGMENWTPA